MTAVRELAQRMGIDDLFILHRVSGRHMLNLHGYGRGAGWAGNIDVDPTSEPWLAEALSLGFVQSDFGFPSHLFGPYWTAAAAAVMVGDFLVVFGGTAAIALSRDALTKAADRAVDAVAEVSAEKRLGDELEVTQAALAVATLRPTSAAEAGRLLATKAAQALSCEFGAVLLYGPPIQLCLADEGWRPPAADEEIIASILPLAGALQGEPMIEQDLRMSSFPYPPLAFDGLVARAAAPLGPGGSIGILVVAHAAGRPRGFTSLCQRVIRTMADTARPVLEDAQARG